MITICCRKPHIILIGISIPNRYRFKRYIPSTRHLRRHIVYNTLISFLSTLWYHFDIVRASSAIGVTASTNVRTSLFDSDLISVLRFTSLQQISNRYRRLISAWPTSASYTKRNSDKVNIKHSPNNCSNCYSNGYLFNKSWTDWISRDNSPSD